MGESIPVSDMLRITATHYVVLPYFDISAFADEGLTLEIQIHAHANIHDKKQEDAYVRYDVAVPLYPLSRDMHGR
jgi:hypothetical protein